MQFTGIIKFVSDEVLVGQKQLPKISFIIEEAGDMEDFKRNSLVIDAVGDKADLIRNVDVGSHVTAHINFKTSEYNGKHYNRVSLWKLENAAASNEAQTESAI